MIALTTVPTIHHYDPQHHLILCGLRGFDHRSTKHARSVTCPACLGLLGRGPSARAVDVPGASAGGVVR